MRCRFWVHHLAQHYAEGCRIWPVVRPSECLPTLASSPGCPGARPAVDWTPIVALRYLVQYLHEALNICVGMETRDCMSGRYVGEGALCLRSYLECEVSVRTAQ